MSFSITESDPWPRMRRSITEERQRRIDGLMTVTTMDQLCRQQSWVEALDWVLAEAEPKPIQKTEED